MKKLQFALSLIAVIVGIGIIINANSGSNHMSIGQMVVGMLIACLGLGYAMGTSVVVAVVCLAFSLLLIIIGAIKGVLNIAFFVPCFMPAAALILHWRNKKK